MALYILKSCIACDACLQVCPNNAIREGDPIYLIDKKKCTECKEHFEQPACIEVCPVDAIEPLKNKKKSNKT